jgi:hypothetical protein
MGGDDGSERVTVVRIAVQRPGVRRGVTGPWCRDPRGKSNLAIGRAFNRRPAHLPRDREAGR